MQRPIAISLSPNTQKDDILLALKTLFRPIQWFNFRHTEKLEKETAKLFGKEYWALAVNSGRSALYLILKSLDVSVTDKIALQGFTCIAVPNSVLWAGARPIYIDVDESFNLDPKDLSKKVDSNTKAVIVQHAFGTPAAVDEIKKVAKKNNLYIIEDGAVSMGAKYKGKKVGTLGDIAFFSFGRDKVISSVFGGMIVGKDKRAYEKIKEMRDALDYPSPLWFLQQLIHPLAFSVILPLYNLGLGKLTVGKIMLFVLQKMKLLSRAVCKEEESSIKPSHFPKKMPGGLSILALNQIKKIEKFNTHRVEIAKYYDTAIDKNKFKIQEKKPGSIYLRYSIVTDSRDTLLRRSKKKGMLLGDWYRKVVVPAKDFYTVGYSKGDCPKAEEYAEKTINLPTYPNFTLKDAKKVVEVINE